MQVYKNSYGEFQVDEENVLCFPQGIPGFNALHRFVILPHEQDSPIYFLQSLDDTDLSFVITDPKHFFADYCVEVNPAELAELGLEGVEEALVFVILVVASDPKEITANLLAPIIINPENKTGAQLVISGDTYTTRHRLFAE